MAKTGVSVGKDTLADTVKAIQALTRKQVLIGIPEANTARDDASFSNAAIGYINEYGAPARNIPARPHLVPGVRLVKAQLVRLMKETATAAMNAGDRHLTPTERDREIDKVLTKVGLLAVNSVRSLIQAGIPPALAESTIYGRQHRKVAPRTGTTPLIDTGAYWNAITFVIDEKGPNAKGVAPSNRELHIPDAPIAPSKPED